MSVAKGRSSGRSMFWQLFTVTVVLGGLLLLAGGFLLYGKQGTATTVESVATTTPIQAEIPNAFAGMHISGQAAIVVDLTTGQTLYAQNADTQLPLASLTKLLTIYAASGMLSPSSIVTISSTSLAQDGESGFTEGETFAYKDIARLALVASSNDAAEAIAEAAEAGRYSSDEELLANAATAAGLSKTYAHNGTGLDVSTQVSGGYGTARDVAKLAAGLLKKAPAIATATTASSITVRSTAGVAHTLPNTNPDIALLPGVLMSKTGYTDLAGGNLVVIFDAGIDHPVAVVVLGSTREARFTDVERLMHATLAHFAGLTGLAGKPAA
ncbi:MAG: serine hydrolase [Patescibacteria group bacterium]